MAGEPVDLLHGIPFTVKDIVNTKGVRTTFGALPYKDNVPDQDAVAVARLRAQGAILIGKTTTPEFGSKCFTDSPLFGRTRNAWSAARSSGGSSGGAAVASGIAPLAVATDGGGSTRIPAACNGVVGLKQSIGMIPQSQVQDAFGNQTYVTPTTRTVADTALMMQAMAGRMPPIPGRLALLGRTSSIAPFPGAIRADGESCSASRRPAVRSALTWRLPSRRASTDLRTSAQSSRSFLVTVSTSSRSGAPSIIPCGAPALRSWRPITRAS